jgi:outer membrane protein
MREKIGLAIMLIGLLVPTYGQEDTVITNLTVADAMALGLTNNEKVKKTILDYEIAKKQIWEVTAMGLPQIDFNGSFTHFIDIPTSVIDASSLNPLAPPGSIAEVQFGQPFTTEGQFDISQILFDGSYIVGLQSSKKYKDFVTSTIAQSKRDVRIDIYKAYYGVLVAQEMKKVVDSIYYYSQIVAEETKEYVEEGIYTTSRLDQANYSLLNAESSANRAKRQVELSLNLLKFQLGYTISSEITLVDSLGYFYTEGDEVTLAEKPFNSEQSLDVLTLQQNYELNKMNVKLAKFSNLPSLYGFFQHKQSAFRNEFDFFQELPWYPTTIYGIQLKIPITSFGMRYAKQKQEELNVLKIEEDISMLNRSLNLQHSQDITIFLNAYETYQSESENFRLAVKIWKSTKDSYNEGTSSSMELSQAQTQVFAANSRKVQSMYDFLNAKTELEKLYNKFDN